MTGFNSGFSRRNTTLLAAVLITLATGAMGQALLASPVASGCPTGFSCSDIGSPAVAGSQSLSGDALTVHAGGSDIWDTADQFHFVYTPLVGDGRLSAMPIASQTNTDPWAKAGVMIRATTAANSPYYYVFVSPGNGVVVQFRTTSGANADQKAVIAGHAPISLRAVRSGSTYTAFTSLDDGSSWTEVPNSSMTLNLGSTPLKGFAVTSHNSAVAGTVVFKNPVLIANSTSTPSPTPTTSGSVVTRVNGSHVDIVSVPPSAAYIVVAVMTDLQGDGIEYTCNTCPVGKNLSPSATVYTPPADHPVVDMIADDANGNPIGGWAGRVQTQPSSTSTPGPTATPAPTSTPKPTPTPAPTPIPTPQPSGSMWVGLNTCCAPTDPADAATVGATARIDTASGADVSAFAGAGDKVIDDISGDPSNGGNYDTGGVQAINANNWAQNAVAWYVNNCRGAHSSTCVAIEVLNEPGNPYFWGSNSMTTTNAAAYANLLKTVHNAFTSASYVSQYGSARPKILAAYDGGWSETWGHEVWASDPNVDSYIDGVTVHPYGGHSTAPDAFGPDHSAQGNRQLVVDAHNQTGEPVFITEVGWPTAVGQPSTGDSLQWTETQQADNIYSFIAWARGTGFVSAVTIFGSRDYGTNNWYGVKTASWTNGRYKPGFTALAEAAHQQACTVC